MLSRVQWLQSVDGHIKCGVAIVLKQGFQFNHSGYTAHDVNRLSSDLDADCCSLASPRSSSATTAGWTKSLPH